MVQLKTTKKIVLVAFILGLFLTWGILIGDEQGRINLLHLLVLYVFIPIFSLSVSVLSIIFGFGFNFATLVSLMPLWSSEQKREFLVLNQQKNSKWILLFQSQLAAISFSLASLSVFMILLISTDMNFIWRSTILNAEQIHPILKWLASPWSFWQSAQPDLDLLKFTQDSRISTFDINGSIYGKWWQFIFAVQVFYALILRLISILVCFFMIKKMNVSTPFVITQKNNLAKNVQELAEINNKIESDFSLVNWCGFPSVKIEGVLRGFKGQKISELKAGPLASYAEQLTAERWQGQLLILVKGWEPPLAELADFMENTSGYILPLDWNEHTMIKLKEHHCNEWRRFVAGLNRWQLVQLTALNSESLNLTNNKSSFSDTTE